MCLGTNMCGHYVSGYKRVWAQTCVGTNVSEHKRVSAQTYLGTNMCGHKRVWAQTCLDTNVCGHKRTCLGTIVRAQVCVGTNVWSLLGIALFTRVNSSVEALINLVCELKLFQVLKKSVYKFNGDRTFR